MIDLKNIFDSSILNVPRFIYDGNVINASELGNIAYGYWGKSLGFTDDELFYGGGVARMLADRNFDNIWNSLITDKYYGDKLEDIEDIMKGIALYNKLHLNMGCGGAR